MFYFVIFTYTIFFISIGILNILVCKSFSDNSFVFGLLPKMNYFKKCLEFQLSFVSFASYGMKFFVCWLILSRNFIDVAGILFSMLFSLGLYTLPTGFCHYLFLAPWSSLSRTSHILPCLVSSSAELLVLQVLFLSLRMLEPWLKWEGVLAPTHFLNKSLSSWQWSPFC